MIATPNSEFNVAIISKEFTEQLKNKANMR